MQDFNLKGGTSKSDLLNVKIRKDPIHIFFPLRPWNNAQSSYKRTVFGCIPITVAIWEVLYVFTANHLQSTLVYLILKVWRYGGGGLL